MKFLVRVVGWLLLLAGLAQLLYGCAADITVPLADGARIANIPLILAARNAQIGGLVCMALAVLMLIAARPAPKRLLESDAPNPDTHVRCPDCRELVRMDASKCRHCGTALVPQVREYLGPRRKGWDR